MQMNLNFLGWCILWFSYIMQINMNIMHFNIKYLFISVYFNMKYPKRLNWNLKIKIQLLKGLGKDHRFSKLHPKDKLL